MFHNPIEERLFESDVSSGFLTFDPLVLQNFLAFGQELFVEHRVFQEMRAGIIRIDVGVIVHSQSFS